MIDEMKLELEALKQRAEDISYMMIEAEGEQYFSLVSELEHIEFEIDEKEQEFNTVLDLYRSEGIL